MKVPSSAREPSVLGDGHRDPTPPTNNYDAPNQIKLGLMEAGGDQAQGKDAKDGGQVEMGC